MRGFQKYIFLLLFGSVAFAALFAYLGYREFTTKSVMQEDRVYVLEPGQGVARTAQDLERRGMISNADIFRLGVRLAGHDKRLKAGEYLIPTGATMSGIMRLFASGAVIQHKLTIVEGWTSHQVVSYLNSLENLSGEIVAPPAEGSLMPETYLYVRNDDRNSLIQRMQKRQRDFLLDEWSRRDPDLPLNSPEEALILASIVEKETALEEERARIAGVFINRLRKGMRLQTDPTVIYGLDSSGSLDRPLSKQDLRTETPYNTYLIRGLPPTPIAHPGKASIRAVLHPLPTDELYFVANGTGGHSFAVTNEEHLRNVRHLRQLERQKKADK
ncbi:endolytic transglycosylase MltG [Luteithermobacter gelatinilyticus]|uniref:endolytic transglycosylase MltG n=1 Tax=Luteithermobacter gelatinilyticus TaxID=2582913 RepID=UPI001105A5CB|nr:endolytic transglycosylase MltG [Luteithermobacter gelatinilyticus]